MKSVDFIHFFRIVLILSWMFSYFLARHYLWYLWLKTRDKSDNWPWHFSFLWAFDKINLLSNMKCRKSIFIFQPAESILLYVTLQKFEVYAWWYATVEYLLIVCSCFLIFYFVIHYFLFDYYSKCLGYGLVDVNKNMWNFWSILLELFFQYKSPLISVDWCDDVYFF